MDYRDSDLDVLAFLEHLQDPDPSVRNVFVDNLPRITEVQLYSTGLGGEHCPICQETFLSVIASEEMAEAMDSPAVSQYDTGVTKLPSCGHHFCRKDISKWIISAKKDTCPACRSPIGLPPSTGTQNDVPLSVFQAPEAEGDPELAAPEFPDGLGGDEESRRLFLDSLRQLGVHIDDAILNNLVTGTGAGGTGYPRNDSRNEFSGMYS